MKIFLIMLALLIFSATCRAQLPSRSSISTPLPEIYQAMFEYIEREDYVRIEQSLAYLSPVLEDIKKEYGVDLQKDMKLAVRAGRKTAIAAALSRMVFYDSKAIFEGIESAKAAKTEKSIDLLKAAYINYLVFSPIAESRNFRSDQKIKKYFRAVYQSLTMAAVSEEKQAENLAEADRLLGRIEKEWKTAILDSGPGSGEKNNLRIPHIKWIV